MSLPPLTQQRRIVAKVEQRMALVDALETQLAGSRATTTIFSRDPPWRTTLLYCFTAR